MNTKYDDSLLERYTSPKELIEDLVSIKTATHILNVTAQTIYINLRANKYKTIIIDGNRYFFKSQLEKIRLNKDKFLDSISEETKNRIIEAAKIERKNKLKQLVNDPNITFEEYMDTLDNDEDDVDISDILFSKKSTK